MAKEKSAHSLISFFRDLALILGVLSSLIGFGPQILDSLTKLLEAKRLDTLYSSYIDYGQELFKDNSYAESVESFREALALKPHAITAQVWFKKARLMYALDKLQDIDKNDLSKLSFEVEFVLKSKPQDIYRYFYAQGNIRYFSGDFQGAQQSYEHALRSKPDYGRALANLGAALNELKRYDEAVRRLRAALQSDYKEAAVYNNLIFALHSAGKNEEAAAVAREGLAHFPVSAGIYNELGIALYKLGRKDESISALKTAYVLTEKSHTGEVVQRLTNLAYPLADSDRIDEALSFLESAQKLSAEDPHVYLAFAHCYGIMGNDEKMVESYEKLGSLGVYPDPGDLIKWAQALERLKRPGEASRILRMAEGRSSRATQDKEGN